MKIPYFTFIVPVYKVEAYIERCIHSIIHQTERNIEIILIDDGSPDNCPDICDEFAIRDQRIRVIHKINEGLSEARNTGIKNARGQYIIFVDSDDYVNLDACAKLLPFTKEKIDVIVADGISEGGTVNLKHTGIKNRRIYTGIAFMKESVVFGNIPMAAWLYVYRREYLIQNQLLFKKGIYHEDEEFTPRAILSANTIIHSGEVFYHYVIRPNSIMTQKNKRKSAIDLFETCQSLCTIYDQLEDNELKCYLKDLLVNKYLSLFQSGQLYKFGKEYLHKRFMLENAYRNRTKRKALLYNISPRLYWYLNFVF